MRAKTMILFVIAVGCGLIASIGVSQYLETASGNANSAVETASIFVAVADINIGEKLDAQNVKLDEWPRDRMPAGAIHELEQLEGRFPRTRLYAGEPILVAKLMDSNDGSKAVDIPEGYRVVSVKVSVESVVGGLVQPGDRVDLLVFLRKSNEVPETGTRTILRDVNVFAVDAETERRVDEEGRATAVRTVSLLVKPEQAEAVTLASELGQLKLSLRRPDDPMTQETEGITIHALLGNASESANDEPKEATAEEAQNSFLQMLADTAATAVSTPDVETVAPPAEPVWKMKIMGPDGFREYRWDDMNEMPVEVGTEIPGLDTFVTPPAFPPAFNPGVDAGTVDPPPVVVDGGEEEDTDSDGTSEEDSPFDGT